MGELAGPSLLQVVLSLYGYFLPLMLYAAWSTLAFWDLGRREDLGAGARLGWTVAVLGVPFLGALAYHLGGGSRVPSSVRGTVVLGGIGLVVVVLLAGRLVGGAA